MKKKRYVLLMVIFLVGFKNSFLSAACRLSLEDHSGQSGYERSGNTRLGWLVPEGKEGDPADGLLESSRFGYFSRPVGSGDQQGEGPGLLFPATQYGNPAGDPLEFSSFGYFGGDQYSDQYYEALEKQVLDACEKMSSKKLQLAKFRASVTNSKKIKDSSNAQLSKINGIVEGLSEEEDAATKEYKRLFKEAIKLGLLSVNIIQNFVEVVEILDEEESIFEKSDGGIESRLSQWKATKDYNPIFFYEIEEDKARYIADLKHRNAILEKLQNYQSSAEQKKGLLILESSVERVKGHIDAYNGALKEVKNVLATMSPEVNVENAACPLDVLSARGALFLLKDKLHGYEQTFAFLRILPQHYVVELKKLNNIVETESKYIKKAYGDCPKNFSEDISQSSQDILKRYSLIQKGVCSELEEVERKQKVEQEKKDAAQARERKAEQRRREAAEQRKKDAAELKKRAEDKRKARADRESRKIERLQQQMAADNTVKQQEEDARQKLLAAQREEDAPQKPLVVQREEGAPQKLLVVQREGGVPYSNKNKRRSDPPVPFFLNAPLCRPEGSSHGKVAGGPDKLKKGGGRGNVRGNAGGNVRRDKGNQDKNSGSREVSKKGAFGNKKKNNVSLPLPRQDEIPRELVAMFRSYVPSSEFFEQSHDDLATCCSAQATQDEGKDDPNAGTDAYVALKQLGITFNYWNGLGEPPYLIKKH